MAKGNKRTELGKVLAKLRVDMDESSAEMAERLEISVSSLSAYEYGRSQPMADFATKMSATYGIDITHLIAKQESRPNRLSILAKHMTDEEFAFAVRLADAATRRAKGETVACLMGEAAVLSKLLDGDPPPPVAEAAPAVVTSKKKLPPPDDVDGVGFIDEDMDKELADLLEDDSSLLMA